MHFCVYNCQISYVSKTYSGVLCRTETKIYATRVLCWIPATLEAVKFPCRTPTKMETFRFLCRTPATVPLPEPH
jgi:predicted ArsR family transcriptional regulator